MIQHLRIYWRYLRLPRPVREELSRQGYARDLTKLDVITRYWARLRREAIDEATFYVPLLLLTEDTYCKWWRGEEAKSKRRAARPSWWRERDPKGRFLPRREVV